MMWLSVLGLFSGILQRKVEPNCVSDAYKEARKLQKYFNLLTHENGDNKGL